MGKSIVSLTLRTEFSGGNRGYHINSILSPKFPVGFSPSGRRRSCDIWICRRFVCRTGARQGESRKRQDVEQRVLGAEGRSEALHVSQASECSSARKAGAARFVFGPWIFHVASVV